MREIRMCYLSVGKGHLTTHIVLLILSIFLKFFDLFAN